MSTLNGYQVPSAFHRFEWRTYSGETTSNVTYMYLVSPAVSRLRGVSPVLYIGRTEQPISKRYRQETETRNTEGNSQATNIRMSHVIRRLRSAGDKIELVFTPGLTCRLDAAGAGNFRQLLQTWNKSHYLTSFSLEPDGLAMISIEKVLMVHYADQHLEVPPLNNSA